MAANERRPSPSPGSGTHPDTTACRAGPLCDPPTSSSCTRAAATRATRDPRRARRQAAASRPTSSPARRTRIVLPARAEFHRSIFRDAAPGARQTVLQLAIKRRKKEHRATVATACRATVQQSCSQGHQAILQKWRKSDIDPPPKLTGRLQRDDIGRRRAARRPADAEHSASAETHCGLATTRRRCRAITTSRAPTSSTRARRRDDAASPPPRAAVRGERATARRPSARSRSGRSCAASSDVAAPDEADDGDPLSADRRARPGLAAALERAGAPTEAARGCAAAPRRRRAWPPRRPTRARAHRRRPVSRRRRRGGGARFGGRVTIARHRHSVDVALRPSGAPPAKRLHKLSHAALDQLRASRRDRLRDRARGDGAGDATRRGTCSPRVYCVVARYAALGGHGHQAALGPAATAPRARRSAELELFAPPFNCRWAPFCSAFSASRGGGARRRRRRSLRRRGRRRARARPSRGRHAAAA